MNLAIDTYGTRLRDVLRAQYAPRRNATKELAREIGATPRTVENWLDGSSSPNGAHLIRLMANNQAIAAAILEMVNEMKASA